MRTLKAIALGLLTTVWIFNMVMIRLIILAEAFVVLLISQHYVGVTMGRDVILMPWHRAAYLAAVPIFCAVAGTIYGQIRRVLAEEHHWPLVSNFIMLLTICNLAIIMGMASAWPESVAANPLAALVVALLMSGVTAAVSIVMSSSPMEMPPHKRS